VQKDQVFISYSHHDKRWCDEFHKHLKPYLRNGVITIWSDRQIAPGSEWFAQIQTELADSKIAVLLVSPDFINSDFIDEHELGPLLKKAEAGGVRILWIPVSTSSYDQTALKEYQAIIDAGKPLAEMSKPKRDRAWVEICKEIQKAVKGRRVAYQISDGMEFAPIPAGEFGMGLERRELVRISSAFYLGKYPVTQAQWEVVMGKNPSTFKEDKNCPVESVTFEEVEHFIRKLNAQKDSACYRLPTEAEWEYACRAGSTTAYCFGDDEGQLEQYAWYKKNANKTTHPVGKLKPNAWGLYDMHGNVWEWVQDKYSETEQVDRGGCWKFDADSCRSGKRGHLRPEHPADDTGFRLLRTKNII
jgi:formylglycine-generating enzyme required for sulfatase activity